MKDSNFGLKPRFAEISQNETNPKSFSRIKLPSCTNHSLKFKISKLSF